MARNELRTFVGIRLSGRNRKRLHAEAQALAGLERDLRPIPEQDLHITLQFIGATPDDDIHRMAAALEEAYEEVSPIAVGFKGLGAFPEISRARAVWIGVEEEDEQAGALSALARLTGRTLGQMGYPPERRKFKPHVTLGRLRRPPAEALVERIEGAQELLLGEEVLSEVKLILSDPRNRPYHYIDLTTVELGGLSPDA